MPSSPALPPEALLADVLRQQFGFGALRPGQEEAIQPVLDGRDTLVVMPTGAGKSLVYQLAACLRPGVTVVISPLIALMKDQVDGLTRRGIPAVALHSAQPAEAQRAALDALREGRLRMVYVAPERLQNRSFLGALARAEVGLLAVDEAHCISQWGHDFRPDYLQIGRARDRMGRPPTVALTATATGKVQDDICETLGLEDPARIVTGFNRPNLCFEVRSAPSAKEKRQALTALLAEEPGPALIYGSTRKQVEAVARFVRDEVGREVRAYHAGLGDRERAEVQDAFISGDLDLVVATNAFGMGVDRADVRLVAHWNIPANLEAYYQEAGRAGRDGKPSRAVLLYAPHDAALREWFIEQSAPEVKELRRVHRLAERIAVDGVTAFDPDALAERVDLHPVRARVVLSLLRRAGALDRQDDLGGQHQYAVADWPEDRIGRVLAGAETRQRHKTTALRTIVRYAEADRCRRQSILDHFGDPGPAEAARCCDVCLEAAAAAPPPDEIPAFDALPMPARIALGLLDAVRRLPFPVGRLTMARLLAGSKAKGMDRRAYTNSPYFGRLSFLSQDDIDGLYRQLVASGHLKVVGGDRPVLALTRAGARALAHRAEVPLELPASSHLGTAAARPSATGGSPPPAGEGLDADAAVRFEALRRWRTETARSEEVPPYIVFNDRTLAALAAACPETEDALLAVSGVGPAKRERYGAAVLAVLRGD
jgi:ATP-dependent DNA helicase RecQ